MNRLHVNPDVTRTSEKFGVPNPEDLLAFTGIDLHPLTQVTTANAMLERAERLRLQLRELVATQPYGLLGDLIGAYARGEVEVEALADAARELPSELARVDGLAHRALVSAADDVERQAAALVATVTETEWLSVLQPPIAALLEAAVADATILDGYLEQTYHGDSRRPGFNAWGPTRDTLEDNIECRQAWERLDHTLLSLNEIYGYADGLRRVGLLPLVDGRTTSEDYRWLHVARLNGRPETQREFFMANHRVADPGLYSAAQLSAVDQPNIEPELEYRPSMA